MNTVSTTRLDDLLSAGRGGSANARPRASLLVPLPKAGALSLLLVTTPPLPEGIPDTRLNDAIPAGRGPARQAPAMAPPGVTGAPSGTAARGRAALGVCLRLAKNKPAEGLMREEGCSRNQRQRPRPQRPLGGREPPAPPPPHNAAAFTRPAGPAPPAAGAPGAGDRPAPPPGPATHHPGPELGERGRGGSGRPRPPTPRGAAASPSRPPPPAKTEAAGRCSRPRAARSDPARLGTPRPSPRRSAAARSAAAGNAKGRRPSRRAPLLAAPRRRRSAQKGWAGPGPQQRSAGRCCPLCRTGCIHPPWPAAADTAPEQELLRLFLLRSCVSGKENPRGCQERGTSGLAARRWLLLVYGGGRGLQPKQTASSSAEIFTGFCYLLILLNWTSDCGSQARTAQPNEERC